MRLERQMIPLFMGVLLSLMLTLGCAPRPVYEIKYDYLAPESAEGKACIQQCETRKTQCEQSKDKAYQQEKLEAQRAYEQCKLSEHSTRSPIICDEPSELIKADYSSCLDAFNRCFGRCGGKVGERNECVRNCG